MGDVGSLSAPSIKEPTDPNPGTAAAWGAPDAVQTAQILKGTYPGQAIPEAAIKNTAMTLGTGAQVVTGSKIFNNTILQINNPATTFQYKVNSSAILANINVTLPLLVADDTFVFANFVQTLTNKTIDGGSNTLANIASASIVTRLTSKDLADSTTISNVSATSKAIAFTLSGMTASVVLTISSSQSTSQTLTIPNITGADTLMTLSLAQTILAAKTFTTGLLKIADIADSNGNKSIAVTATASAVDYLTVVNAATASPAYVQVNATGSDTNIGMVFSPKGTGKFRFTDGTDTTKIFAHDLSGMTTGITLTWASSQSTSQTLNVPNITGSDTLMVLNVAQTVLARKTYGTGLMSLVDIVDSGNNKVLAFTATGSAVNYVTLANSATGNNVTYTLTGSDSNISATLVPKGTGLWMGSCETIELDLTDETTLPTTGVKITTGIPYNFSVIAATAYLTTTGSGATLVEMDALIESAKDSNSFSTIFTTRPKIAASTFTSNSTGSTSAVLTSTPLALTKDTRIQGKIQAIDTGTVARGYKLLLIGYRTS